MECESTANQCRALLCDPSLGGALVGNQKDINDFVLEGSNRTAVITVDAKSVTADLMQANLLHCLDSARDDVCYGSG